MREDDERDENEKRSNDPVMIDPLVRVVFSALFRREAQKNARLTSLPI